MEGTHAYSVPPEGIEGMTTVNTVYNVLRHLALSTIIITRSMVPDTHVAYTYCSSYIDEVRSIHLLHRTTTARVRQTQSTTCTTQTPRRTHAGSSADRIIITTANDTFFSTKTDTSTFIVLLSLT